MEQMFDNNREHDSQISQNSAHNSPASQSHKTSCGKTPDCAKSIICTTPSTFAQYKTLLGKDLRQEFRTFSMLSSMGIYAVLVLMVFGAVLGQNANGSNILPIASGLLWALIVFTSLMGLNRSFNAERQNGTLEGIMLVPLDRSVIFLAKATSNFLLLLVVEIIAIPVFWFLFLTTVDLGESVAFAVVPILLGTIGIAGIGTLLSTISANTRGKDVMLAVLFVPLSFSLLYACATCTSALIIGSAGYMDTFTSSVALAAGYDVIMLLLSWVLYDFVVSA